MGMIRVMLLVLLLVPAWSFAQDNQETKAPSLAELARQQRERRAQLKEGLVITNANLKRVGGGLVSIATGPETEATEGEEGAEDSEKAETDAAVWERRFSEARLNLKTTVNRDLVLQLKMNDLRTENLGGNQARIQQQLLETQQEIEKNAENVHSAMQALKALEGEFQQEGIPSDKITGGR